MLQVLHMVITLSVLEYYKLLTNLNLELLITT